MAFTQSALFTEASRQIQDATRRQFRNSDFGKLMAEVQRARQSSDPRGRVRQAMDRYQRSMKPQAVVKQLMGAEFGGLCREIQRYGKKDFVSKKLVDTFLHSIGPAGRLISALIAPKQGGASDNLTKDLQAAMNLIKVFGGEVLPGTGRRWANVGDVNRSMMAAFKRLQEYGFQVVGSEGPPPRMPPAEGMDVDMGYQPPGEKPAFMHFSPDHPILTGEMVKTPASKEVYEFGYDIDASYLYIRFRTHSKGEQQGGAGSLYRYSAVSPMEFLALYQTRNTGAAYGSHSYGPGEWIWDVLRVRGTQSGHRKDYELVGIMGGYVPRKSTVRPKIRTMGKRGKPLKKPVREGVEEWYEQRTVKTHEGRWVRSVLPTARVTMVRGPK